MDISATGMLYELFSPLLASWPQGRRRGREGLPKLRMDHPVASYEPCHPPYHHASERNDTSTKKQEPVLCLQNRTAVSRSPASTWVHLGLFGQLHDLFPVQG